MAACYAFNAHAASVTIATHLYDTFRSGDNISETVLTPANVTPGSFGLLGAVGVDEQVDAQPLVVPNVKVVGDPNPGTHDVVYLATENNTVYAIDPTRQTILASHNLGPAVPFGANQPAPHNCSNNSAVVGINSTPVIDPVGQFIYVMSYTTSNATTGAWVLHKLSLATLQDVVTPQVVSGSQTLVTGTQVSFNAQYQRQRAALLLTNGSVYAGFGSFCDFNANASRGWLLGWNAATLAPLPTNSQSSAYPKAENIANLVNKDGPAANGSQFYLSSIWMSGSGPATDGNGNIYFSTGNSNTNAGGIWGNTSYNLPESVLQWNIADGYVSDWFTPTTIGTLDAGDLDLGSGGVLVVPGQGISVVAGKDGLLRLLNNADMGNVGSAMASYQLGGCWCAPSYSYAAIIIGTSQPSDQFNGQQTGYLSVWFLVWDSKKSIYDSLVQYGTMTFPSGQDSGFFTTVSSNAGADVIIWAVARPTSQTPSLTLYAIPQGVWPLKATFSAPGPAWPNGSANANVVPVVANGHVYVAGYKSLSIYGLK